MGHTTAPTHACQRGAGCLRCARWNSSHSMPPMPKYMHTCATLSKWGMLLTPVDDMLANDKYITATITASDSGYFFRK